LGPFIQLDNDQNFVTRERLCAFFFPEVGDAFIFQKIKVGGSSKKKSKVK
jgi:hypothetical protein